MDPLLVVGGGVERHPHAGDQVVHVGVEQVEVQVELAGEVLVEHRLAHAGAVRDLVHPRGVEPAGDEDVPSGREQLGAPGRPGQPRVALGHGRPVTRRDEPMRGVRSAEPTVLALAGRRRSSVVRSCLAGVPCPTRSVVDPGPGEPTRGSAVFLAPDDGPGASCPGDARDVTGEPPGQVAVRRELGASWFDDQCQDNPERGSDRNSRREFRRHRGWRAPGRSCGCPR